MQLCMQPCFVGPRTAVTYLAYGTRYAESRHYFLQANCSKILGFLFDLVRINDSRYECFSISPPQGFRIEFRIILPQFEGYDGNI